MADMTSTTSLNQPLLQLWRHLTPRRHVQFWLLLALSFLSAIAEVVTLGAALPFIAVLASPERVFQYPAGAHLAKQLGLTDPASLVLPMTLAFSITAIVAAAVRLLLAWGSTRYTFAVGAEISLEVYRRTLYQPYESHLRRGSSEVISGIANKVGHTMLGVMLPALVMVSSVLMLVAITAALLIVDASAALIAAIGFGGSYGLVTWVTKKALQRNSRHISIEQTQVVKALQEGLGGIRDVLLDGSQQFYCELYGKADRILRRAQGTNVFIAQIPRPPIEAFGMVLIAALAYGLSQRPGGVASALPVLAALTLGAQRLLPALQSVYASWASIVGSQGVLQDTVALLDQPTPAELLKPPPPPLPFNQSIRFEGVRFRYAEDGPWVLDGLDLGIPRGTRVGFVGGTGSGKSTSMDLLMGLLHPTEGYISVDGEPLRGDRIRAWQRTLAHVPQNIYLADASVAENIAFGVPREAIDMERVRHVARQAQIADFIEASPEGYDAFVGERGVRLSGGQRQRIGIARALYKQASVLVLDEATSALDNVTERSVMEAIAALDRNLTVLIIAHRLTTVRNCDVVVQLERGQVVAQGTYAELLEASQSFRQMAQAAHGP